MNLRDANGTGTPCVYGAWVVLDGYEYTFVINYIPVFLQELVNAHPHWRIEMGQFKFLL